MGEQATHSLARHSLTIAGLNIAAGAGKGSLIKITPVGEWRSVTVGIQGDVCVNENANHSATFELTLLHSATLNKALQALLNMTMGQDGSMGIGAFQCTNLDSGTEVSGDCVLTAPPEWDIQTEVQDAVWKGQILQATYRMGGA